MLNGKQAKHKKVSRLHFNIQSTSIYGVKSMILGTCDTSVNKMDRDAYLPGANTGRKRKSKSLEAKEITVANSVPGILWALATCWINKWK